jgi:hypothetical protein
MSVEDFEMRRDVFLGHLAEAGRSRDEVTISTLIPYSGDLGAMVDAAKAFADVGVDLGIVSIPKSDDPSIVEAIAEALA